jgi:pimeloyl-ACP methyl ester carboxylesterase
MSGLPAGLVEYAELPGLSHLAHLEDPARYAATLHGYFRRVEAARRGPA